MVEESPIPIASPPCDQSVSSRNGTMVSKSRAQARSHPGRIDLRAPRDPPATRRAATRGTRQYVHQ